MNINNLFNVSGKTAVVTGGSRCVGEMITAGFLLIIVILKVIHL